MTPPPDLEAEPWRYDWYAVLRRFERNSLGRPRIGDSAARREEYLLLSQDPFLEFPASTLAAAERDASDRLRLSSRFLGMFGPQGALPLGTTEEAYHWLLEQDDAFPRFVDIFQGRFLQLFFRAYADARPIAQHDRPREDRFLAYIGAMIGVATPRYREADTLPLFAKLEFAGLIAPQAKSASRLKGFIEGLFGVTVEIDQFVGSWMTFDTSETTRLGSRQSRIGADFILGAAMYSVQDKIRIRIFVESFAQYESFLPVGDFARQVADAVFLYLGDQLDWDIELAIPAGEVTPVKLGAGNRLGWSSWMAPSWSDRDRSIRTDTRFHLAQRFAARGTESRGDTA